MAGVDLETVLNDLNQRFATDLPEFYNRRIIFWYDPDREFEEMLDDIRLDNAKLLVLTGKNNFEAKKLLRYDDLTSNYLVYDPREKTVDDDNWLINIQLYSESFRASLNDIWMHELNIPDDAALRQVVKKYHKFFNAKARREAFVKLGSSFASPEQLVYQIMAVLVKSKELTPESIIRKVLCEDIDIAENKLYNQLQQFGLIEDFWLMIHKATGYLPEGEPSLKELASVILLSASTKYLNSDILEGLEKRIHKNHAGFCNDLINDWVHSEDKEQLRDIAMLVESYLHLQQCFNDVPVDDLAETQIFPCIHRSILKELMEGIKNKTLKADFVQEIVELRRTMLWYESYSCYYHCLYGWAMIQRYLDQHPQGYHHTEACDMWRSYTAEYYKVDQYYRDFRVEFQRSLNENNGLLDDLLKDVAQQVEDMYIHGFLDPLSDNWTNVAAEDLKNNGHIDGVMYQDDFYTNVVKNKSSRVYVIISDALRFEVAASLAEVIKRETSSLVKLKSCCGIFPTITKFGMAALLPHKSLSVVRTANEQLKVLADGEPTEAGDREAVLKKANPKSVALQYQNLIKLQRKERKELIKDTDVVYIYHDLIDKTSHSSDSRVFAACDEAINEIKTLVNIIINDFSGTNIVITADHGFIYTAEDLTAVDKSDAGSFRKDVVEYGRRYAILDKEAEPDGLMEVKFLYNQTDYRAYAPRENIRIKKSGGGLNYVHGGASLQEMVVPVIECQALRRSSNTYMAMQSEIETKPVTLELVTSVKKLTNLRATVELFQTEAVSANREPVRYLVYFVDEEGNRISNERTVIADKTSEDRLDRQFKLKFDLRSQKYSKNKSYFLVIADENGILKPVKYEFEIDIALADDFNFF